MTTVRILHVYISPRDKQSGAWSDAEPKRFVQGHKGVKGLTH